MSSFAPVGGLAYGKKPLSQPGQGGLKDVLFDMFKQRQGGFNKTPGMGLELPGFPAQTPDAGQLPGGGLAYGFIDPEWFKDIIPVQYQGGGMAQVLANVTGHKPHGPEVHGGPAQEVIESTDNLTPPPMPPPLGPNGHWVWTTVGGNLNGHWVWVPTSPHL